MNDLAYPLTQDAPLDLTLMTLLSGTHIVVGKNLNLRVGESKVFLFYDDACLGVASLEEYTARGRGSTMNAWIGPIRSMTPVERGRARRAIERVGGCANMRGGCYA
jgi:hypothetical protein